MKNGNGAETATPESELKDETQKFSAYGWTLGLDNPFTFDNPKAILDYLVESAPHLMSNRNTTSHAPELLALVDRFLAADGECRKDKSEEGYRKALVAMFMLGVSARSAQEEGEFPRELKLKALQREVTQAKVSVNLLIPNKDRIIGSQVAKSFACEYARRKWSEDKEERIRTGEMTDIVWDWMADKKHLVEHRPETTLGLRGWIREVAAEFPHAQKRGPSRKNNL